MEKHIPSWMLWILIGILVLVNLVLVAAFAWQRWENQRLRTQLELTSAAAARGAAAEAYIKLFADQDYKGEVLTILPLTASPDKAGMRGDVDFFVKTPPDDGTSRDFNDKASSAIYFLPKGLTVILYQDGQYQNKQLPLVGTGKVEKIPDFRDTDPPFNDQASSLRWIQE